MLYAIIIKKTKEVLDAATFKEYWKTYGCNGLYGWRKPKKIYTKLHLAKTGFSHIPDEIKPHVAIASFELSEIIMDGEDLDKEQRVRKEKAKQRKEKRIAKIKLERAKKEFEQAQQNLKKIENE